MKKSTGVMIAIVAGAAIGTLSTMIIAASRKARRVVDGEFEDTFEDEENIFEDESAT